MDQQTIGQRLRTARESLHMSAAQFAKAIGLEGSYQSVYNWEYGKSDVPDRYYAAILSLGINPTWVLTGFGEMKVSVSTESDSVPERKDGAQVVGHVMRPADSAGIAWTLELINALGIQTKTNTEQLRNHEERITQIETIIEEFSHN